MKKLLSFFLLIPFVSFGQRLEISEQAGISQTTQLQSGYFNDGETVPGFSNQVAANWHFCPHFSVKGFYEFNNWNTQCHALGLAPEFHAGMFYCGVEIKGADFAAMHSYSVESRFATSLGYGAYAGLRERICCHWALMQQIGYGVMKVDGNLVQSPYTVEYLPSGHGGNPIIPSTEPFTQNIRVAYLRAGISYSF